MGEATDLRDADARRSLKDDLARVNCRVHQPDDPPLFTREPVPDAQTVHWRWSELEPLLRRLGEQIDLAAGGPRRTLRLHNPGLPYGTTFSFWASIQVILPGEVATCHRHSASAFRFIMRGHGAKTTVDGECYPMSEGDLVLTPAGTWHDHVHQGNEPMIWLDILDISLMRMMRATFFEPAPQPIQGVSAIPDSSWRAYGSGLMRPTTPLPPGSPNPLLAYPNDMAQAALRQAAGLPADPHEDVILEYQNPVDGGPAMRTMGMRLQLLRPGVHTRARRQTGSKLFYVMRGEGTTIVAGQPYRWSAGDFLTVAPWAWHEHVNDSGQEAILFQVNDFPALKALGYYREETQA
jgi:gentisate 1,2-dioxygenase